MSAEIKDLRVAGPAKRQSAEEHTQAYFVSQRSCGDCEVVERKKRLIVAAFSPASVTEL
jgi:hypothetical protein